MHATLHLADLPPAYRTICFTFTAYPPRLGAYSGSRGTSLFYHPTTISSGSWWSAGDMSYFPWVSI